MELKQIDFKDYIKILLKRKKLFSGVFLFIFISALIYTILSPKIYSVKTTLIFSDSSKPYASIGGFSIPVGASSIGGRGGLGGSVGISSLLGPLIFETPTAVRNKLVLESRKIRYELVEELDLKKVYRTGNSESIVNSLGVNTKIWIDKDGLMTVAFNSTNKELAVKVANTYIELLRQYYKKSNISTAKRQKVFIEKQLKENREELKKLEEEIKKYDQENRIYDEDMFVQRKLENLAMLEKSGLETQLQLDGLQESLNKSRAMYIKSFEASSKDMQKIPASKDMMIDSWRDMLSKKEYELLLAKQSYNPNHTKVRKIKTEINQIKNTLRNVFEHNIYTLKEGTSKDLINDELKLISLQSTSIAVQKELEKLSKDFSKLPEKVLEYLKIKRELKMKEVLCSMLEQDLETAKIAEAKEATEIEVLDEASLGSIIRVSPNFKLNMLLAGFMGIVMGAVSAFGWEYLDRILEENAGN